MADIFISYSRKDLAHAERLVELLASAGLSVWIDRTGIVGAEMWAKEIVEGIRDCGTFLILLSPNSVESENVLRELSLASEKRKRVLPVVIEPIVLPASFEYPLAGLQRVPLSNFDGIVYAHQHGVAKVVKKDERKSLMILPFEDLSPTGDNAWFADGIVSELISALSNVTSLRIADNQATKEFKKYQGQLATYAREMNFQYFVQGDVRKFGSNIKITSRLLDIESGDHLWQDSMKGTMEDIFDIQERVAKKVVEGLNLHLASKEREKLAEHGTENAEAYELYMRASDYFHRQTLEGLQLGTQLVSEAILLDPGYLPALEFKASALTELYRSYDRTPALLDEAESLCKEMLRLRPERFYAYHPLSQIFAHRGQLAEAEEMSKEYARKAPQDPFSHFGLGFFYSTTGQLAKAIAPFEEAVRLKPESFTYLWNLTVTCEAVGEREKCAHFASVALPLFERHLRLRPDDENRRVQYANLLQWSGRIDEAHAAAMKLMNLRDSNSLYNTACLFGRLNDHREALRTFRMAIEAGLKDVGVLNQFLTDENNGVTDLRGTPEYEEVKRMVEELEAASGG